MRRQRADALNAEEQRRNEPAARVGDRDHALLRRFSMPGARLILSTSFAFGERIA